MDIFISYSSKNRDLVRALAEDLSSLDHHTWFDREVTGGQDWWKEILKQIRGCDLFVFALTPESLESQACRLEYQYAHDLGKNILPVMLAPVNVRILPAPLQRLQVADYQKGDKEQFKALQRALARLPVAATRPVELPPEPDAPIASLGGIGERIEARTLLPDDQKALLFDLKALLDDPASAADARQWLEVFRKRSDLLASVEKEIARILEEQPNSKTIID